MSDPVDLRPGALPGGWYGEESIWQLVECCGYVADLPMWSGLCAGRKTLDLGCGIGRVSHHLAEAGIKVSGIDRDPMMLADFIRLAPAGASASQGDVHDPLLETGLHEAVIAPQQLIQIVSPPGAANPLPGLIARSMGPTGIGAIAITEHLPREPVSIELAPDMREIDGWIYSSRPVSLRAERSFVEVNRIRHRVSPTGDLVETRNRISFLRVDRDSVRPWFTAAGLELTDTIEVAPTDSHMGSTILVFRKA